MNQTSPSHFLLDRCVNPAKLLGFTQLVFADQVVTKRVFTQWALYRAG